MALNLLNDIFDTYEVGYDPLHLPSMTEAIGSKKVQNLFGLFNQIKQEYVSARFLAYEGLTIRDAMEHSYLKILDFYNGLLLKENDRVDELAYNINICCWAFHTHNFLKNIK